MEVKGKRAVDLKMGSITNDKVQDKYQQYWSFRHPKEATTVGSSEKVPTFVDTFYNLFTDIYEWGWDQSFHFFPSFPGCSHRDVTRLHEERVLMLRHRPPASPISRAMSHSVSGRVRAVS